MVVSRVSPKPTNTVATMLPTKEVIPSSWPMKGATRRDKKKDVADVNVSRHGFLSFCMYREGKAKRYGKEWKATAKAKEQLEYVQRAC